jgi:hypothetical protein
MPTGIFVRAFAEASLLGNNLNNKNIAPTE